jgi:hypothetical protein
MELRITMILARAAGAMRSIPPTSTGRRYNPVK